MKSIYTNSVSIITPATPDRTQYLDMLADCINNQTHQVLEWLVSYDDLPIGTKRNNLCEQAQGQIIVMMDSDDHYEPDYVEQCVKALLTADITGLNTAYYKTEANTYLYEYQGTQPYVMESGMAFWKRVCNKCKFADHSNGEGLKFLTNAGRIIPHNSKDSFYARVHTTNTSCHKQLHIMKKIK